MRIPHLQQDKANHVIYGVVIFAIVASLSGQVMGLAVATTSGGLLGYF